MEEQELEQYGEEDIASILDKIDQLVSKSGHTEDIAAKTVPVSQMKEEELKQSGFGDAQIKEILLGIEEKLPVESYAKQEMNWMQMREIRKGLYAGLDTEMYDNIMYSASQMYEIRMGLLDRLDVTSYAKMIYSATDMKKIRQVLFEEAYKSNPNQFGKTIEDSDTGMILRISDDCMKAYVTIPGTVEEPVTESALSEMMSEYNIVYGIDDYYMRSLIKKQPRDKEVCIANGKPPSEGKSGWYELFFENPIEKGRTVAPDDEIDYSEVNIISKIEKGQLLVKYHPAQRDNLDGMTITGISISGTVGEDLPKLHGSGFEWNSHDNTYNATQKGYASYDKTTGALNVRNVYQVFGDVSYYQSVEYDGTVHVTGSVRNSAIIRAKGDVIIDGFVESAHIYSGQNVVIKSGVNGGGQGSIDAGGSVRGKFFENATITSSGLVEGNYFLNCVINTDDCLIARGRKARIMGGNISAAVGVEAVTIGNYLSNKTFFVVGDIDNLEARILSLKKNRYKIQEELQQLKMGVQKLMLIIGEDKIHKNSLFKKTNDAICIHEQQLDDCNKEIERLKITVRRAGKAYVKIHRELQENVIFIINGERKITNQAVHRGILLTKDKIK